MREDAFCGVEDQETRLIVSSLEGLVLCRQQTGRAKGKKAASKAPSKAKSRVKKEPQEEAAGPTVRVTRSRAAAATTTSAPSNDFPSPPKVPYSEKPFSYA